VSYQLQWIYNRNVVSSTVIVNPFSTSHLFSSPWFLFNSLHCLCQYSLQLPTYQHAWSVAWSSFGLPWLRFFRAISSVVRQMPEYNSQRRGQGPYSSQLGDSFYAVSSSLISVWPLWVRIPESHPTKGFIYVVLCILCVNVYYTTATGCQSNCSKQIYQYINIHINITSRWTQILPMDKSTRYCC